MAQANQGVRLGTTLFSLTNEFHSLQYSFEELIAKVGALGLGPGLEVIGFQSIRGFPEVSDEFADRFKGLLAKHNLVPTCLAVNADVAIRRGQKMTTEESVRYHEPQIRAAAKLGFPVARYQYAAGPEVIERLVPLAEKLQVILGLEVHAPHKVDSPTLMGFREMYQRVRSPFLGFIPDFGASAHTVPPGLLNVLRSRGVSDELIEVALAIWREESGSPPEKIQKLMATPEAQATERSLASGVAVIYNILNYQDPSAWLEIMPQCVHIHGKFYEFDESGNEACIPFDKLLPVFRDNGFNGYMSSEWEGHMYSDEDAFEVLKKHHALCKRILANGSAQA